MKGEELQSPSSFLNSGKHFEIAMEREPETWRNFAFMPFGFTPTPHMVRDNTFFAGEASNRYNLSMRADDSARMSFGNTTQKSQIRDENFTSMSQSLEPINGQTPKINLSLLEELETKAKKDNQLGLNGKPESPQKEALRDTISEFLKVQRRRKASIQMIVDHVASITGLFPEEATQEAVFQCLNQEAEFSKSAGDTWQLKDMSETSQSIPVEYTSRLRGKKKVQAKQNKKAGKQENSKPEVSFDLVIGDDAEEELEYILLNKRQHYMEVINSLDSCLKEAMKRPETKKALPELSKAIEDFKGSKIQLRERIGNECMTGLLGVYHFFKPLIKMNLSNEGEPEPIAMENFMLKSILGEIGSKLDEIGSFGASQAKKNPPK